MKTTKREKAAIYWSDETGIRNQDQIGKGYAPKGQTPVLTQTGQKFSTSLIAAVSNRGLMRFKLYKGALNVAIFIDFMTEANKGFPPDEFKAPSNAKYALVRGVREAFRPGTEPKAAMVGPVSIPAGPQPYNKVFQNGITGAPNAGAAVAPPPPPPKKQDDVSGLY